MRQRQLIEKAVGPAPWYWQTFPEVTGASGKKYIWRYHGEAGPVGYLVTLNLRQSPDTAVLALNSSCRPFPIGDRQFGVWCEEQPFSRGEKPYVRVMSFDPDALAPFPLEDVAGWFKQSNDKVYAATAPSADFEIACGLAPGAHTVAIPEAFREAGELLMPTNRRPQDRGFDARTVIYVVRAQDQIVDVLPQKWFQEKFDGVYEWLARVTRDPSSGRLLGDGLRVPAFELADNGCDFGRWVE